MTRPAPTRRRLGVTATLAAAALLLAGCGQDAATPVAAPATTPTTSAAATTTTADVATPVPATTTTTAEVSTTPPADCGVDLSAAAVSDAIASLPTEPGTGADWYPQPLEGNYDPCATLSTALVTIEGATGSSPVQALMFHDGEYLGTGTSRAYGLTSWNEGATTDDTVVLDYRSGQSCTACDDGVLTTVRYRWDGSRVQMLDPAPPVG